MNAATTCFLEQLPAGLDRAVIYGDGVFETIAVFNGVAPLWKYHKQRLTVSLARLGILADVTIIEAKVLLLVSQTENALLRLVIARGGGNRGYDSRNARQCIFMIDFSPLPAYSRSILETGVTLHLCKQQLARNPALAGIKHLNRLEQVLAASEWDRSREQEGLLLDDSGAVIEGTVSNLFLYKEGALLTPALDNCGVAGVMRQYLLEVVATELRLRVEIRRLTLDDVLSADACFVCNSVFGLWPVARIGVSHLSMDQSLTEKILSHVLGAGYDRLYA